MMNLQKKHDLQRGVTLIVTLVMLVMMMLLAVAAINMSTTNLKIVGNMQVKQEATSAAQSALNQVMSSGRNLSEPSNAPTSIVVGAYQVALTRPCLVTSVALRNSDLSNPPNAEDQKCLTSSKFDPLMPNNLTDCALVTFEMRATAREASNSTGAQAEMVQAASIRMDRVLADVYKRDASMVCP